MKILKKFLFRQAERRLRKLPALDRGVARFKLHYKNKYAMGTGSYGLPVVHDWDEGSTLKIGSYCSIATNVQIFLGGNHHADWVSTYPFPAMVQGLEDISDYGFSNGNVVIGSDVWLCSNTIILSGVTVGHGAIVAAGSVVTSDVEPYSIVGGNPARHLKWRFSPEIRAAFLETAWWEWPVEEVCQVAPLLCSDQISNFLAYAERRP